MTERSGGMAIPSTSLFGIDRLRREMLAAGIPSEHAAVAAGMAAEYASTAYTQGHGRGFNQGVEWQKSRMPNAGSERPCGRKENACSHG